MPFTPFHFGPGLLVKSVIPGTFSFVSFVCTQVVIDLESLYNLQTQRWPVHRFLHSGPGAVIAGLLVAVVLGLAVRHVEAARRLPGLASGESCWPGLLLGGLVGGASHSLLDGIMHSDVRLFYPLGTVSNLHGLVGVGSLHVSCVISAVVGMAVLGVRYHRERVAR